VAGVRIRSINKEVKQMNGMLVIGKVAGVKKAFELLKYYDLKTVNNLEFIKGAIFGKYGVKIITPKKGD
jgi:hypothetical protein